MTKEFREKYKRDMIHKTLYGKCGYSVCMEL